MRKKRKEKHQLQLILKLISFDFYTYKKHCILYYILSKRECSVCISISVTCRPDVLCNNDEGISPFMSVKQFANQANHFKTPFTELYCICRPVL